MTREKPEFLYLRSIRLNSSASSETTNLGLSEEELKSYVESHGEKCDDYYNQLLKLVTDLKDRLENLYA